MEIGTGSRTESGGSSTNSSTESLSCLRFGHKIYFEDAGVGVGAVAVANANANGFQAKPSSSASRSQGRKNRVNGSGYGQPPRCQVEGCNVDLSDAKSYYSRHKVCGMHSKSPKVIVAGLAQRFCQQCSRFHLLPEFDQGKRSCRRRLAGHNERRRKPPPGLLLSPSYSSLSMFGNSNGDGGFAMDLSAWPTTRATEHVGMYPWPHFENPAPEICMQPSLIGNSFSDPVDCFANTNSALSLLSNQQSCFDVNRSSWGFTATNEAPTNINIPPVLGLGLMPQPDYNQFSGAFESYNQQNRRQDVQVGQSTVYGSTQYMNWSL